MKTTVMSGVLLASLATAAWAANTCLPIVNNDVTVDGIVAGGDIGGAVTVPPTCPTNKADTGWAGAVGQDFPLVNGIAGSKKPTMFLAAHQGGGPNLDKIYLAVHVESAPDFTTNDQLTIYFQKDATKPDWDAANDFALVFGGIGPSAGTPSDAACSNPGGQIRYYKRDNGNATWQPQATVPAAITAKTSYNYVLGSANFPLWELEIGIDVSNAGLNLSLAKGQQVGLGAKLYLFEGLVEGTTAYHYPMSLTPNPDSGDDFLPNQGGVTPSTLQKITVGACTFDVVISSIQGSDAKGNPNKFTQLDPNSAADFNQTTGQALKQNQFQANVMIVNPDNIADTSPINIPDTGNVLFHIKPWNGGFVGDFQMAIQQEEFKQLGQSIPISVKWPRNKSDWQATGGLLNTDPNTTHACFFVDLGGFTVDLPNGNEMMQNLTYVASSTIKSSFLIAAPCEEHGIPGVQLDGDDWIDYILRVHWDNLAPKFLTGDHPFKYQITNAHTIGLRALGKDYYSLRLRQGRKKQVKLEITGGAMPHPNVQYKLSAQAGGQLLQPASGVPPLQIPVKPGALVSILLRGQIALAKHPPTDANGYQDTEQAGQPFLLGGTGQVQPPPPPPATPAPAPGPNILRIARGTSDAAPRAIYRPEDHIGAVIASCDNFKTSFVVGTDSTFAVPEGCNTLLLGVNDIAGHYEANSGELEVNVVVGDPISLPTRLAARGSVAHPELGVPAQLQPGSILPQLVVDVSQRFRMGQGYKKSHRYQLIPTGYVAYAVYATHPEK
jgi:hypothetical protein